MAQGGCKPCFSPSPRRGCFLFAAAPDFLSLVASRAIIGLGFSAGLMASFKASSIWVPIERRSLANASIMSAGALGIVMATEPTAFLVTLVGWRSTFTIFGGIIVAGAAFVFLAVPEKDEAKTTAGLGRQVGELMQILKLPLFWRIAPLLALDRRHGHCFANPLGRTLVPRRAGLGPARGGPQPVLDGHQLHDRHLPHRRGGRPLAEAGHRPDDRAARLRHRQPSRPRPSSSCR